MKCSSLINNLTFLINDNVFIFLSARLWGLWELKIKWPHLLKIFHMIILNFFSRRWLFCVKTFSMMFGPSIEGIHLIGFKVSPRKVFHTFFWDGCFSLQGVTLSYKDSSMMFGQSMEGIWLIDFKVGPIRVLHIFLFKAGIILFNELVHLLKDFFHNV